MTGIINTALVGLFVWAPLAVGTTTLSAPAIATPSYTVSMTGYNAVPGQTDEDPYTTASGAYSNPDVIAARSSDLADELPFGTVIEVDAASSSPECGFDMVREQIGLRVVGDAMNPRMHNKIDILFDTSDTVRTGGKVINSANALGRCQNVEIHVVGKVDTRRMPTTQQELRLMVGRLKKADAQLLAISK